MGLEPTTTPVTGEHSNAAELRHHLSFTFSNAIFIVRQISTDLAVYLEFESNCLYTVTG